LRIPAAFGRASSGSSRTRRSRWDTNSVERALRGVAVGRKNHYGSRSERGTRTAALFYSLIESAKLCRVEPRGYLREATLRAVRNPGIVTLPRDLK
jgi:transposase